jgi:hypothetical protein
MNIFVLNTGRCGSTTFAKACEHIDNYSCGHETRTRMLHQERLNYPVNHIEADNRLSWFLGRLDKEYGDNAFYVHLRRNEGDTARSFAKRYSYVSGIIKAYRDGILMGVSQDSDPMSVSRDYYHTVNSNIDLFLKDKSKKMVINLESIDQDFTEFWNQIAAEGDINAALSEFRIKYNATREPQENSMPRPLLLRIAGKMKRLITKFPIYVRNA